MARGVAPYRRRTPLTSVLLLTLLAAGVLLAGTSSAAGAPGSDDSSPDTAPDPAAILLGDAGSGFTRQGGDSSGAQGTTTRTFRHPHGELQLTIVPVTGTIDVRRLFPLFANVTLGLQPVDVPGLSLARWLITPGATVDDTPAALVVFASRRAVFSALLVTDGSGDLRPVPTLLALAERQIERAGGPPPAAGSTAPTGLDEHEALLAKLLPARPSARFGPVEAGTISGRDELPAGVRIGNEVERFLSNRSHTVARAYAVAGRSAAVGITEFPYDIFAAAALQSLRDNGHLRATRLETSTGITDAFTFAGTGADRGQVGIAFRRGPLAITVLAAATDNSDQAVATALATDLARQTARLVPAGASAPYRFPPPPSTLIAVVLSSLFITAAAGTSIAVGRARAWTLRRAESGPRSSPAEHTVLAVGPPTDAVMPLDDEARELRHRGYVVLGVQLLAANVIVVALAGDFAWTGVVVAALGLAGGLAFTSWWRRRELAAVGPGPTRHLVVPRAGGLVLGVVALAVLVFGVSYTLKGLRYLLLNPTLAQLRWSNRLGLSPRGVGVAFAVGGVAVTALGGVLFRSARALGRATTHRLLEVDRRPPILYLRSFGDDALPVATIPSARRPFFELFSFRGRDPFEEAVAWELASYGPVIAVGKPGHRLASLGAAREHLADDTWQAQVAARMVEARVVAIATGETPGLRWELQHVVTGGHLHKTVFVFPPATPDALTRRWAFTATALQLAGAYAGPLPCPADVVHTAQIRADGTVVVTAASRRDEASYRTAVDRAMAARDKELATTTGPAEP